MADRLRDKVAIVTGAGQGIGEAIARAFAAEGAPVVVTERNAETGRLVADEPYPVAKHALISLTRSLGVEYAPRGVRVNAIAPGYIKTAVAVAYWNGFADPTAERKRIMDLHPPRRIGRPEDVGMTVVFLASDEALFINAPASRSMAADRWSTMTRFARPGQRAISQQGETK